jgi:predicted NUDIX family NTP pyrophosphohydrolase
LDDVKLVAVPHKLSAGLLMYRRGERGLEVLLVHPGGPFFRNKDAGAWGIPKGEPESGEAIEAAARREFCEEVGLAVGEPLLPLGEVRQKGGKTVHAWAFAGAALPPEFVPPSNTFDLEWPPRSGRHQAFPEIDRAEMFTLAEARVKITPAQIDLLDRLVALVGQEA